MSPSSTLQLRSTLPTELNAIIIQQLPLQSLLQAVSVCSEFQLEAEVHIYKYINILPAWSDDGRFLVLRDALASSRRRRALVGALDFKMDWWGAKIHFWIEALSFLLSTLYNVKTLIVPSFDDMDTLDPQVFFQTPSRFEELCIKDLEPSPRLMEFYASQPAIRKLVLVHHSATDFPIPETVLPALEELVCAGWVVPVRRYIRGRSILVVIYQFDYFFGLGMT